MTVPPWHWWRTVFFLIPAISVYTIVLGTISIASTLFDRSGDLAHGCARLWARLILKTTGVRVTVRGLDAVTLPQSCVFASNHQSIYDIPVAFASLPAQVRIVAKASLGRIPFLGWHLQRTGHLLVDRSRPGAGVVKKMARIVDERHSLIVFPEGTRSVDGAVARFKGGPFAIAVEAGIPVVPISLAGTRHVMQKGRLMVCPGRVTITVHAPIDTRGVARDNVRELAERVREIVRTGVDEPTAAPSGLKP